MKLKAVKVSLSKYEIEDLARIGASKNISAAGQAELFIMAGLECGELVHRIDPHAVQTLCGAEGKWRAVNTAMGVTCPRCLELLHTTAPAPAQDASDNEIFGPAFAPRPAGGEQP